MTTYGVVVVDDAPDLRMLIALAFRRDGRLEVLAAVGDGQQGIDAVRAHGPDVVVMDVSMPVMDGLTATRKLKEEFPRLPIMILTGYGDTRVREEAARAGADEFMDKTEPLSAVADAVAALVDRTSGTG
ncbi:MAG: response regulator transcription factor [Actinobacteria bacterium]|nr:response regulator transcription factor [Actinomycetota bacterium]